MTLLQNREHGADAFDPGDNEDGCFFAPASFVVTAILEGMTEDLWVRGFVGRGRGWSAITLNQHSVR
jgi:hypothetical protein